MEKEWVTAIAALIGVIIGGTITSFAKWLELRFLKANERRKLILSKLEELHKQVSQFLVSSGEYAGGVIKLRVVSDETTKSTLEGYSNLLNNFLIQLAPIGTLVKIYAPELNEHWNKLTDVTNEFHQMCGEYLTNRNIANEVLQANFDKFINEARNFLDEVEKLSVEYTKIKKLNS